MVLGGLDAGRRSSIMARHTYLIDGQSARLGKKVAGTLVETFVFEADAKRVGWYDGAGVLKAQFVFGCHPQVPAFMVKGGTVYRFVTDQAGSIRLVLDYAGGIAQRIDYDEFGHVTADSSPGMPPFV